MFVFVGQTAWTKIFTQQGPWDPLIAITWCTWAAYSTLSVLGIFHTLKMLPIMVFMVFYKGLWLMVAAYPLWKTNSLKGSAAEELTSIFIWIIIPFLFIPWKYVFKKFILFSKKQA